LQEDFLAGNRVKGEHNIQETTRAKSDKFAHNMYYQDCDWEVVEEVKKVAAARAVKPAQVALAWILQKPAVSSAIIGATKIQHLNDAVDAVKIKLTEDEIKQLEKPYKPHPVLGFG